MAESRHITRRAAVIGALFSSAALGVPAVAAARTTESTETAADLAHRLQAALEKDGRSWLSWLTEEVSLQLAANLYGGFDASISPAVEGEPVVWLHSNAPKAKMDRHLRSYVRLAREVDPTIKGARMLLDEKQEGAIVLVLQRHYDDRPDTLTDRRIA